MYNHTTFNRTCVRSFDCTKVPHTDYNTGCILTDMVCELLAVLVFKKLEPGIGSQTQ